MSVEAITWAFRQPIPNSSAKFLLVALANRANPDNAGRIVAYPSIEYMAAVTSQNRKTIMTNLARLREWELIVDTGNRVGRTGQVIVYELKCPPDLFTEQAQKRNRSENGPGPKSYGKRPVFSAKEAQKRATDSKGIRSYSKAGDETRKSNPAARAEGMRSIQNLLGLKTATGEEAAAP